MSDQLDIFNFIESNEFCDNPLINEIVSHLDNQVEQHPEVFKGTHIKKEYSIWDHVPNLGYRLSYVIYFELDEYPSIPKQYCKYGQVKLSECLKIVDISKEMDKKGIEISFAATPLMFHVFTIEKRKS